MHYITSLLPIIIWDSVTITYTFLYQYLTKEKINGINKITWFARDSYKDLTSIGLYTHCSHGLCLSVGHGQGSCMESGLRQKKGKKKFSLPIDIEAYNRWISLLMLCRLFAWGQERLLWGAGKDGGDLENKQTSCFLLSTSLMYSKGRVKTNATI